MASTTGRTERTRARGRERPGRAEPPIAALDLGTNNCRLLVARPKAEDFMVLDAFSRAVRLGEGVEGSNRLADPAQDRAIKALRICAGKIRHHRVRLSRIVATEACRRATNADAFLERVAAETGLVLDVITAEEEARLAVAGCAPLVDPRAEQLLVFDIGGGSTELIWIDLAGTRPEERRGLVRALAPAGGLNGHGPNGNGANGHALNGLAAPVVPPLPAARITDWISLPLGVSTLSERFAGIADERLRFLAMSECIEGALAPFAPFGATDRAEQTRALQVIGVSGTATTFGAIHLGLRSYNRDRVDGLWLAAQAADRVAARLLEMGPEGRACHPGIGQGRAGIVLAGAAILMTILRTWPVARMRIADRGLREGMLYGLLAHARIAAG